MPISTEYVENMREIGAVFGTDTAPQTGQYYSHIYSQSDPNTGVPTLGVELREINNQTNPLPINNLTDAQILEMVQSGRQVIQDTTTDTFDVRQTNQQQYTQVNTNQYQGAQPTSDNVTNTEEGTSAPLGGIFILILLLTLVGFAYFIIRMWQDHQAQKLVMTSIKKKPVIANTLESEKTIPETNTISTPLTSSETIPSTEFADVGNWRTDIEQANNKLMKVLGAKGIEGETVSDKLKAVKPGQFALADMAWEAQQAAKTLLTAHESDISEQSIKRTLQLFKQVFAEHNVI